MAHEGHELRTKHRQDISGSSSCAPMAMPKQLAKGWRPSSLHESYPEDSTPRGGTHESPDEVECLKMPPGGLNRMGSCQLQQGGPKEPCHSP
jgi:hypothetical protein